MEKGTGLLKRAYLVLRWPVVLVALGLSVVFFLTGLLSSLGYQGTTNLRAVPEQDSLWTGFKPDTTGHPFAWKNDNSPTINDGIVNFDKRLIRFLGYLKNDKNINCGWDRGHEFLELDIKSENGALSDLTVPPNKTRPASTLFRGVGVRISKADYIKCTIKPRDQANPKCAEANLPLKFRNPISIPLGSTENAKITPEVYDSVNCKVTCAMDYYQDDTTDAIGADTKKPNYLSTVTTWAKNPGDFDYDQITEKVREAAIFKTALLTYELMNTDEKGCENKSKENLGSNRLIPTTTILPNWIVMKLGDSWDVMKTAANAKFPFGFQKNSPLASLTVDPLLNEKGLHINY